MFPPSEPKLLNGPHKSKVCTHSCCPVINDFRQRKATLILTESTFSKKTFCLIFCFFTRKNNLILSAVANAKSCHFHQNFRFAHQKQAVHFLFAFLSKIFNHRGHFFNFEMNFSLDETFGWESFCWISISVDEWNQIEIYLGLVEIFRLLSFLKLLNWSKDVALIWPLSERLLKERER